MRRALGRMAELPARLRAELASGPASRHRALSLWAARPKLAAWAARRRVLAWREPAREVIGIALCEHLGDVVAAEPVARYVRSLHPGARIVWIVRAQYRELVASFADVDEVWTVRCSSEWIALAPRVRGRVFDGLFDLHLEGRYCETCYLPYVRADGGRGIDASNYYRDGGLLRAFCRTTGIPDLDHDPRLLAHPVAAAHIEPLLPERPFVALHARSNQASRDWNAAHWAHLARWIAAQGLVPIEVGLERAIDDAACPMSLAAELTPLETAEVLRRATLFVGVDSGPAHLAHAVGTPGVVLLGRYGAYERYVPYAGAYGDGSLAELVHHAGPLGELPPEPVIAALQRRLSAPNSRRQRPRVSIVIPAYNHAEIVHETVASALAQTGVSKEVIVVDDGSPDDTAARLAALNEAGTIRLVRQPNRGVAAARNRGLREAAGEFVCFLDDDDLLRDGALEELVDELARHPGAVLAHGGHEVLEEGTVRAVRDERPATGEVLAAFRHGNRLTSPGQVLVRKSALDAVGGFDERVHGSDDWDLWLRLAGSGPFVRVDTTTLRYRAHPGNASRAALRLTRAHLRVALRHHGPRPFALAAHLGYARSFFVPLLLAEATELRSAGRPRRAALSALATLVFDPRLLRWRGLAAFVATGLVGMSAGRASSLVRSTPAAGGTSLAPPTAWSG